MDDFQRTYNPPKALKVKGLPKYLRYRWVNEDRISKFLNEGWKILEKGSSIGKEVTVGYNDAEDGENRFTYRGQTLMICHEDLMKDKMRQMEIRNKAPMSGSGLKEAVSKASAETGESIVLEDNSKEVTENIILKKE